MNKNILFLALSLLVFSCKHSKTETLKGTLYFKSIGFSSFYGMTKIEQQQFENSLETIKNDNNSTATNKEMILYFDTIKALNLSTFPTVKIQDSEGVIHTVFLDSTAYDKLKNYRLDNLLSRKSKVAVTLEVLDHGNNILFSDKINSIQEIPGTTPSHK